MSSTYILSVFAPSDWTDLLNAASHFIDVLVSIFGTRLTGFILVFLFFFSIWYRRWQQNRRDKTYQLLVAEKERTISRLSEENLNYRVLVLKQIAGWSDDQLERFVLHNVIREGVVDTAQALKGESLSRRLGDGQEKQASRETLKQRAKRLLPSKKWSPRKGRKS